MKSLLTRQLHRLGLTADAPPTTEEWKQLLATVERTYSDADQDRYLLERSLTISSRELRELNENLRAQSESKLSRLVATYDAVLEAAIDGVLVTDERGRAVRWSKRFAELFGMPDHLMSVGDPAERMRAVAARFADGDSFVERTREIYANATAESCDEVEFADGRVVERISSPIRVDHEVIGRVWFYRDITLRKQHEAALTKLSEQRHQFLFEASPLPIWVFEPSSLAFLAVNEAMVKLLGYTRAELLAMKLSDVKPASDIPIVQIAMIDRSPGIVTRVGVKPYRCRDGKVVELDITSHSVVMGGRLVQLAIATDVTEQRRMEERLRQSQKLDAIGRLAGGVAHDFNNILAAILSNAECAREEVDNASIAAMLREIELAAERGASLTRQLLTFSRKQQRQSRVLDVNGKVNNIERLLRRVLGEHIEVILSLAPDLGAIHADASQIEQVVMNLMINARDAMPDGGRVIVETMNVELDELTASTHQLRPGSYIMLSVTDTGSGMDAETRARIFEPFFTTKDVGKGTGLGLATVFGIVQQSEGAISVYSEVGRGSAFKIYLPRCDAARNAAESPQSPVPPAGGGRILLVEDDDLLRASLERRLKNWGYAVTTARDPIEAIELVRGEPQPFKLMLTDLVMPQMDGRTLAERIQPASPETKILFMSGYTQHAAVKTLQVTGREHFIAKPFTGDQLARALRHALAA
jgi:PAS domain S-box-containing protein